MSQSKQSASCLLKAFVPSFQTPGLPDKTAEYKFNKWYNQYYMFLAYETIRLLKDRDEAMNVTLDTFLKLWERRDKMESDIHVRSFLYATARNRCRDILERKDRALEGLGLQNEIGEVGDLSFEPFSENDQIRVNFYSIMLEEIGKIPTERHRKFATMLLDGFKDSEIAKEMSMTNGAARKVKQRILDGMRNRVFLTSFSV